MPIHEPQKKTGLSKATEPDCIPSKSRYHRQLSACSSTLFYPNELCKLVLYPDNYIWDELFQGWNPFQGSNRAVQLQVSWGCVYWCKWFNFLLMFDSPVFGFLVRRGGVGFCNTSSTDANLLTRLVHVATSSAHIFKGLINRAAVFLLVPLPVFHSIYTAIHDTAKSSS